jgi:hypothetical protein
VAAPLRLMVYDATWAGRRPVQLGLTSSWIAGGALYRAMGRLDAVYGARSWTDALAWLCSVEPRREIAEVQYWGHGRPGRLFVAREALDASALLEGHERNADLVALRARLAGPDALFWFRTCETFGRAAGHAFARSWTRFFGCRAAGHTYVIGPLQSGLHSLGPGDDPTWSTSEGLAPRAAAPAPSEAPDAPGEPEEPALMSHAGAPNTITCLHGRVPAGW